ncbi:uncharacterized protein JCM6883_002476 [Sporobolomyces salmoneus]|uniref:uncharacterized protein n=1 Tax=Sporobolomyces salmoneus TaxID=183962 RepID=UPI00317789A1
MIRRDRFISHCRVHIALRVKPHVCSVCMEVFGLRDTLKKHEKTHTEEHHAKHRRSKAIIGPSKGSTTANVTKRSRSPQPPPQFGIPLPQQLDAKSRIPAHQQAPHPFSFPTLGYPYHFMPQPQPGIPQIGQGGGGIPQQSVDHLPQFIALQQQLDSQAQAAASQGFSLPGMNRDVLGYPLQLGQNPFGVAAPGLSFVPQGVYPLGGSYGYSAPGQHHPQYVQVPLQSNQPLPQQYRNSSVVSSATPNSLIPTPAQSSLYPSLPSNMFPSPTALPSITPEDQPSPAHYYKSQYSSISSPSGVPVLFHPSLSTPENSYLSTPQLDSDSNGGHQPYRGGNQVAGKKRAFDEAAEHFLGESNIKRSRYREEVDDRSYELPLYRLPALSPPPPPPPEHPSNDPHLSNEAICPQAGTYLNSAVPSSSFESSSSSSPSSSASYPALQPSATTLSLPRYPSFLTAPPTLAGRSSENWSFIPSRWNSSTSSVKARHSSQSVSPSENRYESARTQSLASQLSTNAKRWEEPVNKEPLTLDRYTRYQDGRVTNRNQKVSKPAEERSKEPEVQRVDVERADTKRRLRELLANMGKNSGRVGIVKGKVNEEKQKKLSKRQLEIRRRNLDKVAEWELELEEGDRWLQEWEEAHKDIYPKKEDEMLNPTTVLELEAKAKKPGPCILQPPSGPISYRWRPNMTSYVPTSKLYRQFEDLHIGEGNRDFADL